MPEVEDHCHRRWLPAFLLITLLAASFPGAGPAQAQEDASFAGFQLNRSLPGARSLALGGAFVAVADDATAAFANPAGLSQLERPEISAEARSWSADTFYTSRGRAGFAGEADLFETGESTSDTSGLSFASFVWASTDKPWSVGVYRHQLADFSSFFASQGVVNDGSPPLFGPYTFSTDFAVENTGLSASWAFDGGLSIGLGVSHYELSLSSIERVFRDPPPGLDSNFIAQVASGGKQAEDEDVAVNAGLLLQLGPRVTLGAAYRQGPSFAMREFFQGAFDVDSELTLPDQWAVGLAIRPTDRITVSLQYDRVEYSSLLEGNRLQTAVETGIGTEGQFRLDDANELRLGVEMDFQLGRGRLLTLAVGAWHDPDHTLVYDAAVAGAGESTSSRFRRAYFRDTGEDQVHASFGAGLTVGQLQINLAADLSSRQETLAVSTVYWF